MGPVFDVVLFFLDTGIVVPSCLKWNVFAQKDNVCLYYLFDLSALRRKLFTQFSAWRPAYWGLKLIAWIHGTLGAVAVIPWNPKRQKNRSCLPPTWTREELGKRSGIERFFGRVFLFFHLQRPPLSGWSTMVRQVSLTYTATIIVALAAQQAGRPDLIRSPKRVLAHTWEGF